MPRLEAIENGVTVRMYRQGHGDCFLLAFPRQGGGEPVYILIDCGLKPGSQNFVHGTKIQEIVDHIREATDSRLDLVVITHEHQDHVNGFWKKNDPYFKDFTIDRAWLAWTESPTDPLAIELRRKHKDQLLGLVEARHQLANAVDQDEAAVGRLDSLLSLEFGGDSDEFNRTEMLLAASDPAKSSNKQAMKLIKDKANANHGVDFLDPGQIVDVPGTQGVCAYVLGPPKNEDLLTDEDPVGDEGFSDGGSHGLSFAAAARATAIHGQPNSPFRSKFQVAVADTCRPEFFFRYYGPEKMVPDSAELESKEVPDGVSWRRIDDEWLYTAENLALKLNEGINNTSLVLAFELPQSKKVLLFVGDAQRGNWISWAKCSWEDGDADKTRGLLARTVLYKVGHHGSHNATLKGDRSDDYANLSWMGQGPSATEFVAMITAVNEWAMTKNNPPWRHPLPSIRDSLDEKAQGRVFQTDKDEPEKPNSVSNAEWKKFSDRIVCDKDYFDYLIVDGDDDPAKPQRATAPPNGQSSNAAAVKATKKVRAKRGRRRSPSKS